MSPANKLPGPMLGRRDLLHMTAAVAGVGVVRSNAEAASAVRLISGFGAGNPTDLCVQLIQNGLEVALDEPTLLEYAIGETGMRAAREVIDSNPDGKTLLVAEILNLVLHDARGGNLLPRLTPIAKITRGFSTAIITSQYSGIADWESLLAAAKKSRLKAATMGPLSPVGILLAMLERRMNLSFDQQETDSTTAAADLVRLRRVDLAAVDTRLALLHNSRDNSKFRIITTSGARRSRELPQVPTFAEVAGDPKLAYTISYGVFAPARIDPAVAARLSAALMAIRDDDDMHFQARLAVIPLQIDGPSAVVQAIARDRRVAENLNLA
jgi:tripartite-type tricarboxylate transporter receptor subunit TctC